MTNLTVERWTGPEGILQEILELMLLQPQSAALPVNGTDWFGDPSGELKPTRRSRNRFASDFSTWPATSRTWLP
jgi:hypothetical protein